MTNDRKLYLMLHEDSDHSPDYGQFVSGHDPISAVEGHYAEMDAWCSPAHDPDYRDEYCVWLHEIPEQLAEIVQERFENVRGGEYTAATAALLAAYPEINVIELNVVYTAEDGAKASFMPQVSDLFGGIDKG
jgi:hypothetical protein